MSVDMRVNRDIKRQYGKYRQVMHSFKGTLTRRNVSTLNSTSFLKSGFRQLKEHHSRYIPTFIYDFTNTNHRAKSYSSMLFSTNSLFREEHVFFQRNPSAKEWMAWFPQIFHTGHALHSPFRILEIINTLSTMSVSKKHASVDSCRRSRLNRVYRICRICRFDMLFLLSYCISRALSRGRIKPLTPFDIPQNDNSLTHNAQIKHRDYTNV